LRVAPRTILYTGKGGVGKTSVAAATARRCAEAGLRTVVLSTDPAHSLSDSFEQELGSRPTEIGPCLWGQEVQAQTEMESNWEAVSMWLGELLADRGVDRISAEELTVPPGMDELFSLLQIKHHHQSGEFDAIIVDCAPTGETLRLLSFPDVCTWWLEKVFPFRGPMVAAARPFAGMLDMSLPSEAVFDDIERLVRNLVAMNDMLRDGSATSIRLVMTPDRMVVKEAMRTFTYLNLYGYLTDSVVVNRVFPEEVGKGYFGGWRERQQEHLDLVRSAFSPIPILTAQYFSEEVLGPGMLDQLGDALFEDRDAAAVLHEELAQELIADNGTARLRVALPFTERGEIELKKIGLEVVVRVAGQKRTIMLPPALATYQTTGARLADGALEVDFQKAGDGRQQDHTT